MDPLTHIVAGGLAGQAVRRRFPGKTIVPFGMLAAWIPDIDNFLSGDPEFYLLYHRAFTHSFAGGIVLAAVLAGVFWMFKRKTWKFGPLFLFAYGCVLLHIFLDWINNYGTLVFSPFTDTRHALGSVFIIDPILTGTLLILFACCLKTVLSRKPLFATVALGFLVLYPFVNYTVKTTLEHRIAVALDDQDVPFETVRLSPDFLTPFRWKLIVETEDEYLLEAFTLFRANELPEIQAFRRADREKLRQLGEQESFFATYEWFAVYITVSEAERDGNRLLTFSDLRFKSLHPWARRLRPDEKPPPFSVKAELDPAGTLVDWSYLTPRFGFEAD